MNNEKHGKGTHSTKMDADSLAKNTPNAPISICPICLPKPKNLDFNEKRLHWASIVHALTIHKHLSLKRKTEKDDIILSLKRRPQNL